MCAHDFQWFYFGDLTCDAALKDMCLVTIIIRWVMIVLYVFTSVNHLMDKIRQENKRKFGRNPYKKYRSSGKTWNMWGQGHGHDEPEEHRESVGAVPATSEHVNIELQETAPKSEFTRSSTRNSKGGNFNPSMTVV